MPSKFRLITSAQAGAAKLVAIAASPALSRALAQWGYRADDVVGIVINGSSVQLYVHPAA